MTTPVCLWRHGWYWAGFASIDWKDWGFALGIRLRWRAAISLGLSFGPFYVYLGWEQEEHDCPLREVTQ